MLERTYKLKSKKSLFEEYIHSSPKLTLLPSTHKKEWKRAIDIIKRGVIEITDCDVFKEKLEYLFYGRPAYYVASGINSRGDNVYLPVCFIIKTQTIKMRAVFPFDTGAFATKMYDGYIHSDMDINNFQLSNNSSAINKFVSFFYENNDNYYKGQHKTVISIDDLPDEIISYQNILNNYGETKYDSRCKTIEIITNNNIKLTQSLEAIILPYDMTRRTEWKDFLKDNPSITVITYNTFGDEPGSYNAVIRDKMYTYLCKKGYIDLI